MIIPGFRLGLVDEKKTIITPDTGMYTCKPLRIGTTSYFSKNFDPNLNGKVPRNGWPKLTNVKLVIPEYKRLPKKKRLPGYEWAATDAYIYNGINLIAGFKTKKRMFKALFKVDYNGKTKYSAYNMTHVFNKGSKKTIEFRQHHMTLKPETIEMWLHLCTFLHKFAKDNATSPDKLEKLRTAKKF